MDPFELAAEAKPATLSGQPFQRIEPTAIENLLTTPDALLLDCRRVTDYQAGHIEPALHAHDALVESLVKRAPRSRRIIIYCYTGHSSEHLAEFLAGFGFADVYSVVGGYERWQLEQAKATEQTDDLSGADT